MARPLLSICIPTYNRACFLKEALCYLQESLRGLEYQIEVIISDNHSEDDTQVIVSEFIDNGLKCRYIRNEYNIGPDRNFIQCFSLATGYYTWLIGDDDYLRGDSLKLICSFLTDNDYGLVHIDFSEQQSNKFSYKIYKGDNRTFLTDINIMITFLSGNIVKTDSIKCVMGENYIGSYLVQVPYFINAAISSDCNAFVYSKLLFCGANAENNGGYNFFHIFMDNYLSIWQKYVRQGALTWRDYSLIKKRTFFDFYSTYIFNSLMGRKSQDLDTSKCMRTTLKYFGLNWYFYAHIIRKILKRIVPSNN